MGTVARGNGRECISASFKCHPVIATCHPMTEIFGPSDDKLFFRPAENRLKYSKSDFQNFLSHRIGHFGNWTTISGIFWPIFCCACIIIVITKFLPGDIIWFRKNLVSSWILNHSCLLNVISEQYQWKFL